MTEALDVSVLVYKIKKSKHTHSLSLPSVILLFNGNTFLTYLIEDSDEGTLYVKGCVLFPPVSANQRK